MEVSTLSGEPRGVYTVWRGDQLIYVGMAGRALGPSADTNRPASTELTGLRNRLASHAYGRRSGDQFCIYVFDRLVLPTLSLQQIQNAARGQLSERRRSRVLPVCVAVSHGSQRSFGACIELSGLVEGLGDQEAAQCAQCCR
jgi:hypothetical protein